MHSPAIRRAEFARALDDGLVVLLKQPCLQTMALMIRLQVPLDGLPRRISGGIAMVAHLSCILREPKGLDGDGEARHVLRP
jgi:hypothetical protein